MIINMYIFFKVYSFKSLSIITILKKKVSIITYSLFFSGDIFKE